MPARAISRADPDAPRRTCPRRCAEGSEPPTSYPAQQRETGENQGVESTVRLSVSQLLLLCARIEPSTALQHAAALAGLGRICGVGQLIKTCICLPHLPGETSCRAGTEEPLALMVALQRLASDAEPVSHPSPASAQHDPDRRWPANGRHSSARSPAASLPQSAQPEPPRLWRVDVARALLNAIDLAIVLSGSISTAGSEPRSFATCRRTNNQRGWTAGSCCFVRRRTRFAESTDTAPRTNRTTWTASPRPVHHAARLPTFARRTTPATPTRSSPPFDAETGVARRYPSTTTSQGAVMTTTLAPAAAPTAAPTTAAELAARIQIPRRLPVRYDGQPLRHLSHSSYSKFLLCPDDWRRHYLKGERTPPSAAMFLGARVDDALSTYYRHLLEHGQTLTLDQLHDAYRDHWTRELAAEHAKRGVALGRRARRAARVHDRPRRARAHARRARARSSAVPSPSSASSSTRSPPTFNGRSRATWTSRRCGPPRTAASPSRRSSTTRSRAPCTRRPRPTTTRRPASTSPAAGSRASPPSEFSLRADRQARHPAQDDEHAASSPPAAASDSCGRRSRGSRRPPARSSPLYERYGPDEPWGFADPSGWKCSPRYCAHHHRCPGGGGL